MTELAVDLGMGGHPLSRLRRQLPRRGIRGLFGAASPAAEGGTLPGGEGLRRPEGGDGRVGDPPLLCCNT